MDPPSPSVFISYSHDTDEHKQRVLALADRLRQDGIDAILDRYAGSPEEGWPRWMFGQIKAADFVLVVCTETYYQRFWGLALDGLGVNWEGAILTHSLYAARSWNPRFVPVLFDTEDKSHIPEIFSVSYFSVSTEAGYLDLYRHLTGQPETPPPPIGPPRELPPSDRPDPLFESDETRGFSKELQSARQERKALSLRGEDITTVQERILDLRRKLRAGPQLQAGDLLLDRFELVEEIGHGGFAVVWKAWDEEDEVVVAVKVLHGQYCKDRTRRQRFFNGARRMAKLHHPHVVKVLHQKQVDDGHYFFVMEYLPGGDFRQAVCSGALSQDERLQVVRQIGDALEYAHERQVIHRDVKPHNILLDTDGTPKLTDFDLVRALESTQGTKTGFLGTPLYAAPEMMERPQDAGPAADVYGLGMTALFALAERELPLSLMRGVDAFLADLQAPEPIKKAVHRAVAWNVQERFSSVAEFCSALELPRKPTRVEPQAARSTRPRLACGSTGEILPPTQVRERQYGELGIELVHVPAGVYPMGAKGIKYAEPVHQVQLSEFWIGKYPVTREQYAAFLKAHPDHAKPLLWTEEGFQQPRQPVVGVNWHDAKAFCGWIGAQLPTEAQWEAAARGPEGRPYPWGPAEPTKQLACFGQDWETGSPEAVDALPEGQGPFGTWAQAGHVWEWCEDGWDENAYAERAKRILEDPAHAADKSAYRVLRGGSWAHQARNLRAASRNRLRADYRYRSIGFRVCVSSSEP